MHRIFLDEVMSTIKIALVGFSLGTKNKIEFFSYIKKDKVFITLRS